LYMQALEENRFPECAGIALGFDRLLMLLIDEPDIHNVVAFSNEQPL
jgi:elongation factor P--beta-lysine ligase